MKSEMKDLVRAEVLKLRTTRGAFLLLLGAIAINVFTVVAAGENAPREFAQPLHEQQAVLIVSMLMRILLLVLGGGDRGVPPRHDHSDIARGPVPSEASGRQSDRGGRSGCYLFSFVTVATVLVSMNLMANMNDITVAPLGDSWRTLVGALSVGVIWPAVGLGVGLLISSQVAAIVGGVVWLMGLEQMIGGRLGNLRDFLPGEAGLAAAIAPSSTALWIGSLALLGWAVVTSVGGALVLRRRDIA